MLSRVGAAAGGPGSDSNTHYDARTTHNTCEKSPRVSSRSHMVHSARHAAQRIHTRAKTGPRALNGCPHSAVRHTARHKQPCVATPHAALSAQLMSRWSRTARPHRVRPAREASCLAPLQRRHDKVPPPGISRGFPPIAPLINCPFHSKNILDEAIRGGAGSAGSASFA